MRFLVAILPITCLLLSPLIADFQPGIKKNRYYYEARGDIIWEVPTDDKLIALTFDDGPNPKQTPEILDILSEYGVRSTFFVIGERVNKYPDLARWEALNGHEIANHTYSHKYFLSISMERILEEMLDAEKTIIEASGQKPTLFRPPGGYYNERIVEASHRAGYQLIMWSWHQDTRDWDTPGVDKIANRVLDNARNGDIILFHDHVRGKSQTADALRIILPELKKRGYQFVTVSELLTHRKPHGKSQEAAK